MRAAIFCFLSDVNEIFSLRYLTPDFFGRSKKFYFFFFFFGRGVKRGRRRFVKFVEWENCWGLFG